MSFSEYLLVPAGAKHFAVNDIRLSQPRELERKRHRGLEHEAHAHTAPGKLLAGTEGQAAGLLLLFGVRSGGGGRAVRAAEGPTLVLE